VETMISILYQVNSSLARAEIVILQDCKIAILTDGCDVWAVVERVAEWYDGSTVVVLRYH
jgi:hypothetical protein